MEIFLLWLDDLDDLVGVLRFRAPAVLSFAGALALFAVTVFTVMQWPWLLAVGGIAAIVIFGGRALSAAVPTRFRSDP